jgi:cold shock CspA family protein
MMSTQLDRIERLLQTLCGHLGVRDLKSLGPHGNGGADTESGRRYEGTVSRFEHGWGFIECEALGRSIFVHGRDIEGAGLRSLEAGETASFELGPGKDGRSKAVRVQRHVTNQTIAGHPALSALPSAATMPQHPEPPVTLADTNVEEDQMPQPESAAGDHQRQAGKQVTKKRVSRTAVSNGRSRVAPASRRRGASAR